MKHLIIILLLTFLVTGALSAQEGISTSGGKAQGDNGTVNYTVGQVFYTVKAGKNGLVSEGVQQPYEIFVVSVDDNEPNTISLKIYPNPTVDNLTLIIDNISSNNFTYQLLNIEGKVIRQATIVGKETEIETTKFTSGAYFLRVMSNNNTIKTFKIIKH